MLVIAIVKKYLRLGNNRIMSQPVTRIINMNSLLFIAPGIHTGTWSNAPLRKVCNRTAPRACAATSTPPEEEVDNLFARLNHVNKNLRKKAAVAIAEFAADDEISRLIDLLQLEDVDHRRAAVQTLGLTGLPSIPPLIVKLTQSDSSTVRASCAKALAAISLFFPEHRAAFPLDALRALETALQQDDDPVTRLSVVGCLGSLGCDAKGDAGESYYGCAAAIDLLDNVCRDSADMAMGATAVSAMAQIAQNGSLDRKKYVLQLLTSISQLEASDDPDSALKYVKEIAASYTDQLQESVAKLEAK